MSARANICSAADRGTAGVDTGLDGGGLFGAPRGIPVESFEARQFADDLAGQVKQERGKQAFAGGAELDAVVPGGGESLDQPIVSLVIDAELQRLLEMFVNCT